MAEGAPLLREYRVNTLSRVRIPPSPPFFKVLESFGNYGSHKRLQKMGVNTCGLALVLLHCAPQYKRSDQTEHLLLRKQR